MHKIYRGNTRVGKQSPLQLQFPIQAVYVTSWVDHIDFLHSYPRLHLKLHKSAHYVRLRSRVLQPSRLVCWLIWCLRMIITLFSYITMLCGTVYIVQSILHIQSECEEYSAQYSQSHRTLLWNWIMLWVWLDNISKGGTTLGGTNSHLCVVIGLEQLSHHSWHKGVSLLPSVWLRPDSAERQIYAQCGRPLLLITSAANTLSIVEEWSHLNSTLFRESLQIIHFTCCHESWAEIIISCNILA